MKVYCTHCQRVNKLTEEDVRCGHCSQFFPDELYYQQSTISYLNETRHRQTSRSTGFSLATVATVAIVGGALGYYYENKLDEQRYPIDIEYQLIAKCTSQSFSSQHSSLEQCICALKETQKTLKSKEIEQKFVSTFQANLNTGRCK